MALCGAALNGAADGFPPLYCERATGYSLFMISRVPTAEEIPKICANSDCMGVIAKIRNAVGRDCQVSYFDKIQLYAQVLDPIAAGCSNTPKTSAPPPPTTAAPPPPTTAAPPPPTAAPAPKTTAPAPTPTPTAATAPVPTTATSGDSTTGPSESSPTPVVSGGSSAAGATTAASTNGSGTGGSASNWVSNSSSSNAAPSELTTKPTTSSNSTSDINTASTSSGGVNVSLIAGIAAGVVVIVALIAFLAFRAGKKRNEVAKTPDIEYELHPYARNEQATNGTYVTDRSSSIARTHTRTHPSGTTSFHTKSKGDEGPGAVGLWGDRTIQAARIPLEAIEFGAVLSRGAFGEVLRGSFEGQTVAIKRLLTERRKNMHEIETFLEEVKLVATLRHPRIVRFIGVAWDSLSDLCIVAEFMDGGDLRSLMTQYDSNNHPTGFNADKVKIAMHIAHSLSYLHGLSPNVVHRDLKSKNVLLTKDLDAKLTDFGVSRQRADATMTAGVGSSLWMAPEVMIGERYSEKADIFSFGVVLSELDSQLLPYAHAFEPGSDRKLPEMAILQMVSMGRISIEFSEGADPDIVETAQACVDLDPANRPTANEVLHRFHHIWRHYRGFV